MNLSSECRPSPPPEGNNLDTGLPEDKLEQLCENCYNARQKSGLSAEEVAEEIGKSPGYIYQLERAVFNPPLAVLVQLRDLFNLKSLATLLRGV